MSLLQKLSVNLLELTLQNLPFGYAIFDFSGDLKYSNKLFAEHFNIDENEISNKNIFAFLNEETPKNFRYFATNFLIQITNNFSLNKKYL
ncbi:MAG: PAS domain-containing protein [Melioribacteraceae bacterium]|nr:PAS domain-containing protein [Melioribacteraceae bacterium]